MIQLKKVTRVQVMAFITCLEELQNTVIEIKSTRSDLDNQRDCNLALYNIKSFIISIDKILKKSNFQTSNSFTVKITPDQAYWYFKYFTVMPNTHASAIISNFYLQIDQKLIT